MLLGRAGIRVFTTRSARGRSADLPVKRLGEHVRHQIGRVDHTVFGNRVRAEFEQNRVRRDVLIVVAFADENILDQSRIEFVCDGF